MKRLIGFLVGLYPKDWRERYGEELRTLIEDSSPQPSTALDLLKGAFVMRLTSGPFVKQALIFSMAGKFVALVGSYFIANRFEAVAVMRLDGSSVDAQRLGTKLVAPESLAAVIQNPMIDLYRPTHQDAPPIDRAVASMRKDLQISVMAAKPIVMIRFRYKDRKKAFDTVQALLSRFVDLSKWRGVAVTVLDPPNSPQIPVFPNRRLTAALGFIAGFGIAVLTAMLRRIFGNATGSARLQPSV